MTPAQRRRARLGTRWRLGTPHTKSEHSHSVPRYARLGSYRFGCARKAGGSPDLRAILRAYRKSIRSFVAQTILSVLSSRSKLCSIFSQSTRSAEKLAYDSALIVVAAGR